MIRQAGENRHMTYFRLFKVSLAASALVFSPVALAQSADEKEAEPPADAPSPDDPTLLTVSNAEANASDADAKIALLQAQLAGLQAQLDTLKAQLPKAIPTWKGAPVSEDKEEGWSFKVRGRVQLDAAYAGKPANYVANRNLGFNARVRRFRLGIEGAIPGGFGYKMEADYANAALTFGDVIFTYAPVGKPFAVTLGNFETMNGMEQISSSRWASFIERSQGNDAFSNTRRLGIGVGYKTADNLFRFDAGAFTAHSIDGSFDNDGWIGAARAVYTPFVGKGFVHLGANFQHREFQSNNNAVASTSNGAPSTNQIARYRARPFLQTTDVRYVDTGNFAAKGDSIFGVEAYGVFKSLHLGGEAQWTKTDTYRPGDIQTGLDSFVGGSLATPATNPSFFSIFGEVGYFLTGETRGYKSGTWDRTKVLKPFNKGGWGALQLTGRFDYLDLDSDALKNAVTNNFATGATSLAAAGTRAARGGTQTGYLLGLTWMPSDYVRFLANYIHTEVKGGPFAAAAQPLSTATIDNRKFSTDAFAVRAQIDF